MKASFDVEQPAAKIVKNEDKVYIFICINGEWVDRKYDELEDSQHCWECDYREIITTTDKINTDDVIANPEKYLNWEEKSESDKIEELQEQNKMLTQCLMEMSEIVYA